MKILGQVFLKARALGFAQKFQKIDWCFDNVRDVFPHTLSAYIFILAKCLSAASEFHAEKACIHGHGLRDRSFTNLGVVLKQFFKCEGFDFYRHLSKALSIAARESKSAC